MLKDPIEAAKFKRSFQQSKSARKSETDLSSSEVLSELETDINLLSC